MTKAPSVEEAPAGTGIKSTCAIGPEYCDGREPDVRSTYGVLDAALNLPERSRKTLPSCEAGGRCTSRTTPEPSARGDGDALHMLEPPLRLPANDDEP